MDEGKAELNAIIARECPLTGGMMIDSIDEAFMKTTLNAKAGNSDNAAVGACATCQRRANELLDVERCAHTVFTK